MNRKRILRSWWLWAAVILFAFLILPQLLSSGSDYHGVSTADALHAIKSGNVDEGRRAGQGADAPARHGRAVTRSTAYTKISTQYPSGADTTIVNALDAAKGRTASRSAGARRSPRRTPGCRSWSACCRSC